MKSRDELDKEIRERRGEVQSQERRLIQKEENLDRRIETYDKKERELDIFYMLFIYSFFKL